MLPLWSKQNWFWVLNMQRSNTFRNVELQNTVESSKLFVGYTAYKKMKVAAIYYIEEKFSKFGFYLLMTK